MKRLVLAIMVLGLSCEVVFGFSGPELLNQSVKDYVNGDVKSFMRNIKKTFEVASSDPVVTESALRTYRSAKQKFSGLENAVDWKLPSVVDNLVFRQKKTFSLVSQNSWYQFSLAFDLHNEGAIKRVQLVRYPSETILDSDSKDCDVEQGKDGKGAWFEVSLKDESREPLHEGLYTLMIVDRNGAISSGWFIVQDLVSSTIPEIQSPYLGQNVDTQTPSIIWKDFRSTALGPNESRMVRVRVNKLLEDGNFKDPAFVFRQRPARSTQVTSTDLERNANYRFIVGYSEESRFGPMKISRDTQTVSTFSVAK